MSLEGIHIDTGKTIHDKSRANIVLCGETLKAFSLRSGTRQGDLLSPVILVRVITQEKEIKGS